MTDQTPEEDALKQREQIMQDLAKEGKVALQLLALQLCLNSILRSLSKDQFDTAVHKIYVARDDLLRAAELADHFRSENTRQVISETFDPILARIVHGP